MINIYRQLSECGVWGREHEHVSAVSVEAGDYIGHPEVSNRTQVP